MWTRIFLSPVCYEPERRPAWALSAMRLCSSNSPPASCCATARPPPVTRLEILAEAMEIIGKLFTGKVVKHKGEHFTLESAKLYTLPERPPPIYVATSGPVNAERTGRTADGIITVGAADEKIRM